MSPVDWFMFEDLVSLPALRFHHRRRSANFRQMPADSTPQLPSGLQASVMPVRAGSAQSVSVTSSPRAFNHGDSKVFRASLVSNRSWSRSRSEGSKPNRWSDLLACESFGSDQDRPDPAGRLVPIPSRTTDQPRLRDAARLRAFRSETAIGASGALAAHRHGTRVVEPRCARRPLMEVY